MNLRSALAALSLTLSSATAFAQTADCDGHVQVAPQPVFVQPGYAQPGYAQPGYAQPAPQPVFVQPGYVRPAPQPVFVQPAAQVPAGQVIVQGGYPQGGYAQPGFARPFAARREFMRFAMGLRTRLAQAEQQLRVNVSRGAVAPQAMEMFAAQRAQIEGALAAASQDGFLAPQEQFRLDRMTARAERVDARFAAPFAPVAWGYGRGGRWR